VPTPGWAQKKRSSIDLREHPDTQLRLASAGVPLQGCRVKVPHLVISQVISTLTTLFKEQRYADKAVEYVLKNHRKWGSRDRRLFAESVYECVRHWRWLWHAAGFPDAEHADPQAITEMRVWSLWASYWLQRGETPPSFDELRGLRTPAIQKRLSESADLPPTIRHSLPDWLDARCAAEVGETAWPAMRAILNEPTSVYLRVNTLKIDRRSLREKLAQEGHTAENVEGIPSALRLVQRGNVFKLQSFQDGLYEVQDASSQCIAPFLEVEPGMKVIDACAGAGGKTLHLAAMMRNKGRIIALDIHDWKLRQLRQRCARAGVDVVEARAIEGTKTLKRLTETADRLLLDVPCSGMGVLRRNPDTKWKLQEAEITRLTALQADILTRYSQMVKPGGKMVYATCSILPTENEKQVEAFLSAHPDHWQLEAEMKLNPAETGHDGFYAARLSRRA
jgi:16S rRNA (cytosine967-C5)-methyltransferase